MKRPAAILAIPVALAAGLLWLGYSCRYALQSGANSDVYRQWTVAQYVKMGVDPYRVGLDILRQNFGDMEGESRRRLRDFKIYEIHPNLRAEGVAGFSRELGPPTATYPPSPLLLLSVTIGQLPKITLLQLWLVINLATLALLIWKYASTFSLPLAASCALFLAWPPAQEVIRTSQFGFLVVFWFLVVLRHLGRDTGKEILYFSLVLLKPSLSLPLLILPFVRGRWLSLAAAASIHVVMTLILAALVHAPALTLLSEWSHITKYMLQGAYTLQEILNRLGLENSAAGMALTLAFVASATGWCWLYRRADTMKLAAFLSLVSVFWTYHERYDFIVLLIPVGLLWQKLSAGAARSPAMWIKLAAFVFMALSLTDLVYLHDEPVFRLVRWAGRLALALLLVLHAADLRADCATRKAVTV